MLDLDKVIKESEFKLERLRTIQKLVQEIRKDVGAPIIMPSPQSRPVAAAPAKDRHQAAVELGRKGAEARWGKAKAKNGRKRRAHLARTTGKPPKYHYRYRKIVCAGLQKDLKTPCGKGALVWRKDQKGHPKCMERFYNQQQKRKKAEALVQKALHASKGATLLAGDPIKAGPLGHQG